MHAVKFGFIVFLVNVTGAICVSGQDQSAPRSGQPRPSSGVRLAVAQTSNNQGSVRQVVGKQPESPAQRSGRGLIGAIFGSRDKPANQSSSSGSRTSSSGLFSRFGGDSGGDDDGRRVIESAPQTESPDWTGVPFHKPKPVSAAKNTRPITDPNDPSNRDKRLVGQSQSSPSNSSGAAAKPVNSRIPVPPTEGTYSSSTSAPLTRVASRPAYSATPSPASPLPTAPELNTSTYQPLSATDSSRRTRRRSVSPLAVDVYDASLPPSIRQDAAPAPRSFAVNGSTTEREPRVNRRPMPGNGTTVAAQPSPNAAQSTPTQTVSARRTNPAPTNSASVPPSLAADTDARPNSLPISLQRNDQPNAAAPQTPIAATQVASTTTSSIEPAPNAWQPATSNDSQDVNDATTVATSPINKTPTKTSSNSVDEASNSTPTSAAQTTSNQYTPDPITPGQATSGQVTSAPIAPVETTAPLKIPPASTESVENSVAVNSAANNIVGEIPGIRVITIGPADIPVRQTITYKIVIENLSNIDAPGAMVQLKLPTWVAIQDFQPSRGEVGREDDAETRHLLWMVEGLPATSREELVLNISATEAKPFNVNTEWAIIPKSSNAPVVVREPKLDLIIEGPDQVVFGESETYKVRVINPGTGPSESVLFTLSPNSATPQSQRIGLIPAGKEAQFEVELTARDMENLQIHGLASGDLNLKAEKIKEIQVVRAQLEAVATGPTIKYQDSEATYNLEISNVGQASSKNINAFLQIPTGSVYIGGIDGAAANGNRLTWTIAELPAGGSVEYTFRCKMSQTGQQKFDFTCAGTALGKTSVDFITQVDALADLVLTINDPPAPAPVGKEVVYEIVVRNRGSKVAEQVVVLAQFGAGIEPIRIEGAEGEIVPGQVKFAPISKIDAGQQVVLKVFAKAEREGHHRFCTEVSCGDTLLISEEATRYMEMVGQRVSRRSGESNQE